MMKAASPVDGNVAFIAVEAGGALHAATSTDAAELEKTVKDGAVVTDIVLALLSHKGVHVVGGNFLQKLDVFIRVKLCHLGHDSGLGALFSNPEVD
jgi:hypothetical protein